MIEHTKISEAITGYELDHGEWSVISPVEKYNYLVNPSLEVPGKFMARNLVGTGVNGYIRSPNGSTNGIYSLQGQAGQSTGPAPKISLAVPFSQEWYNAVAKNMSFSCNVVGTPGQPYVLQVELCQNVENAMLPSGYVSNFDDSGIHYTAGTGTPNTGTFYGQQGIYFSSDVNGNNRAFDTGLVDGLYEVLVANPNTATTSANFRAMGLLFRGISSTGFSTNNYLFAAIIPDSVSTSLQRLVLYSVDTGVLTQLAQSGIFSFRGQNAQIKADCVGNQINLFASVYDSSVESQSLSYTLAGALSTKFNAAGATYAGYALVKVGAPAASNAALLAYTGQLQDAIVGNYKRVLLSRNFITANQAERLAVTFQIPSSMTGGLKFSIVQGVTDVESGAVSNTSNVWGIDSLQLESGGPTSYMDGDLPGHIWQAVPHNSYTFRPATVKGGNEYKFTDLGLKVIGLTNTGIPLVSNMTAKLASLNGSIYRGTNYTERVIVLSVVLEAVNDTDLKNKKMLLQSIFAPDYQAQQAKPLILAYQSLDDCGLPVGPVIEAEVIYSSGLEGSYLSGYQESMALQLLELRPPSTKERFPIVTQLSTTPGTTGGVPLILRQNGEYSNPTLLGLSSPVYALLYGDNPGEVWIGQINNVLFYNKRGIATGGGFTGPAYALTKNQSGVVYAGGNNTYGGVSYLFKYISNTWVAALTTNPTATVRGLACTVGNRIAIIGEFTNISNRIAILDSDGSTMLGVGTGLNGVGYCVIPDNQGNFYAGGVFTTAGGVTVNSICKVSISGAGVVSYSALRTGTNGTVYCGAIGPDGRLYIGGSFTTVDGQSISNVAVWNGNNWQSLGAGLNNTVRGMDFDQSGRLIVIGDFTGTATAMAYQITNNIAVWTGSEWLPFDLQLSGAGSLNAILAERYNELWIGGASTLTGYSSSSNQLTVSGNTNATPNLIFSCVTDLGFYPKSLKNETTGKTIYFNQPAMKAGEQIILTLIPGKIKLTSSILGDITNRILDSSDLYTFGLVPGQNNLSVHTYRSSSTAGTCHLSYNATYTGFNEG